MNKTKIDWCDCTCNPVVGCPNGCEYCYGRRQNNRFHYVENWDVPEFKPEALEKLKAAVPRSVFIDSMSDIGRWGDKELVTVLGALADNPQHVYIALTKTNTTDIFLKLTAFQRATGRSAALYIGKSITTQAQADAFLRNKEATDFLSVEPILEALNLSEVVHKTAAVIIGAETGPRKDKVVPRKEWIDEIVKQAEAVRIPVFMKESLRELMGADFRQDPLPWMTYLSRRKR